MVTELSRTQQPAVPAAAALVTRNGERIASGLAVTASPLAKIILPPVGSQRPSYHAKIAQYKIYNSVSPLAKSIPQNCVIMHFVQKPARTITIIAVLFQQ